MNCDEFQKLLDAHLDGELAGTLRLEFDAHRVNCAECEHSVTLLEAVSTVVAAPPRPPALPADFTDRVMAEIAVPARERGEAVRAHRGLRIALVAGALVQAAAVYMFAVMPADPSRIPVSTPPESIDVAKVTEPQLLKYVWELYASRAEQAGTLAGDDLQQVKQFAMNLNVGDNLGLGPVGILQALVPAPVEPADAAPASRASNQFSF
jgi:hypothetical protein